MRRRSTLDPEEKQKRAKLVEIYAILDLCLQLPADDRLLIRNQVKAGDDELANRIYDNKKTKNYHELQIYLRKFVHKHKENNKLGIPGTRCGQRGRTPMTLKSTKNQTEGSYHNSMRNSLQSSPSAQKPTRPQILYTHLDIERHIQEQINKQIDEGIRREQCEVQCKDITPREIRVECKPLMCKSISTNEFKNVGESHLNLKRVLRNRLVKNKESEALSQMKKDQCLKQNFSPEFGRNLRSQQSAQKGRQKIMSLYSIESSKQSTEGPERTQYGQFYKRIKKVIEQVR